MAAAVGRGGEVVEVGDRVSADVGERDVLHDITRYGRHAVGGNAVIGEGRADEARAILAGGEGIEDGDELAGGVDSLGEIAGPLFEGGNGFRGGERDALAEAVVMAGVEELVLDGWAGDHGAETVPLVLLLLKVGAFGGGAVGLGGVGVEYVVTHKVTGKAVDGVGPRLHGHVDDAAAGKALGGVVGGRTDLELINCVYERRVVPLSVYAEGSAVEHEGVAVDAAAVDGDVACDVPRRACRKIR